MIFYEDRFPFKVVPSISKCDPQSPTFQFAKIVLPIFTPILHKFLNPLPLDEPCISPS